MKNQNTPKPAEKRKNFASQTDPKKQKHGPEHFINYPYFPAEIWMIIFDFAIRNTSLSFARHFNLIAIFARLVINDLTKSYLTDYHGEDPDYILQLTKANSYSEAFFKLARQEAKRFTFFATHNYLLNNEITLTELGKMCGFDTTHTIYKTYNDHERIKNQLIDKAHIIPTSVYQSKITLRPLHMPDNLFKYLNFLVENRAYEKISSLYEHCLKNLGAANFIAEIFYRRAIETYNSIEFIELQMIVPFDIHSLIEKSEYEIFPNINRVTELVSLNELARSHQNFALAEYLESFNIQNANDELLAYKF